MLENHYLHDLFHPENVAVIGASERAHSVGRKVMSNLIHNGFEGGLFPINPKHKHIFRKPCYASVKDVSEKIDLAIITTPAVTVPDMLRECGEKGIHAAIVISAGFSELGEAGKALEQSALAIAREYHLRFVGPNCLGVMRPQSHLNATFDNNFALPGQIALVSQSGAVCASVLDWALEQDIGFSAIVSMGNSIDLDFGDILDYLAMDTLTKSILLYIEGVHYPRRFISGLRAAARIKPVIALKAGRNVSGVRAVHSHTGALVGDDDVFTAALSRGGAVRVDSIEQLFTAAQVLSSAYRAKGNRLAVVTNGGGAGVMAADRAADLNVTLPALSKSTLTTLDKLLPPQWSHQNPIDILGDAPPDRYSGVIKTCLQDENNDALLTILVPVAMSQPLEVAKEVCAFAKEAEHKPLIACWMGEKQVKRSWKLFAKNKIPCYSTPEVAVEAFSYLADYALNQQLLLQMPEPPLSDKPCDIAGAESIIHVALSEQRKILTTVESKAVLGAFHIPVSQTVEAHSANEALIIAESIGFPVVMKISSPDITHKQDVDGVQMNIQNGEAVRVAFNHMVERVKQRKPEASISGVTVERMLKNPNYRELMIGVTRDKVFGPVIVFGMGGSLVEVIRDRAVALPPLNAFLARQLIEKTRAMKLLGEFRGKPAVNVDALVKVLLQVSNLVCELPEIQEMDINPLLVDDKDAIAVDARFVVDYSTASQMDYSHMAIHPYPQQLVTHWQTPNGEDITIKPIRPEDATLAQAFIAQLSKEKYARFFYAINELTPDMLLRFTQIDYENEMAFVATQSQKGKEMIIGIARYHMNVDGISCEFAIVVMEAWQKKGVGSRLMKALMEVATTRGIHTMQGRLLAENTDMLELAEHLGFSIRPSEEAGVKLAVKAF